MQTDPVFTERAGFDSYDPYSYVASNPVNFTDPTGESWLSQRAKGLGGKKFWKGVKNVAGAAVAIGVAVGAGMAASALGAGLLASVGVGLLAWPAIGVGYGLLTNSKEFLRKPLRSIIGYGLGGMDYSASFVLNPIMGNPAPIVTHYPGGAVISNSAYANVIGGSRSSGAVAHMRSGALRQVLLHERGHNKTASFSEQDIWGGYQNDELDADLKAGTLNYWDTMFLMGAILLAHGRPDLLDGLMLYNAMINPDRVLETIILRKVLLQHLAPQYQPTVPY